MVSENLKRIREAKGYSKLRLARETGLSARAIEHIEYEKTTNPQLNTLIRLAKALGVSVADLIK